MENLEALAVHRQVIERLIPLLEAIRSVAEIAWRRADQGYRPLMRYNAALRTALEQIIAALAPAQRQALSAGWADGRPIGLLFVASERSLCPASPLLLSETFSPDASQIVSRGNCTSNPGGGCPSC